MPTRAPPKTVLRPAAASPESDLFPALAQPMLELARQAERDRSPSPAALAGEARRLLAEFKAEAARLRIEPDAASDAAEALLAVLDARARANPAMPPRAWMQARERPPSGDALARRAERWAKSDQPGARDLARFLRHASEAVAAVRAPPPPRRWRALMLALALLILAAGAASLGWRSRADLLRAMPDVPALIDAAAGGSARQVAATLDGIGAAVAEVEAGAARSPFGFARGIGFLDPVRAARGTYSRAADALLPRPLADAIAVTLATEGGARALYDALRARAILTGAAEWQPEYLAGWAAERAADLPELAGLARHVAALSGPAPDLPALEAELVTQARRYAAEGDPSERAFLEMARSKGALALAPWSPSRAVPGLDPVLIRRSGRPLDDGPAGLFTVAGWAFARDGGAEAARLKERSEAARLLGTTAGAGASTDDVLDLLQRRTIEAWRAYLADLRVRPFTDQPSALLVSGTLARRASPLDGLIREVWAEIGGEDRTRSHPNQIRIAAAFGPAIGFVEQGRMAEISRLFAELNVALAALDRDADLGRAQLMDVQARRSSVAALTGAPRLVVEIVEDVLVQAAARDGGALEPRAGLLWQREAAPACRAAIEGRYPFGAGPDADLTELRGFFGPEGFLAGFVEAHLAPLLDTAESPWRWKPEARLSGFTPESAAFLQRAAALGPALFGADAVRQSPLTLAALAQRGAATVGIGGAKAPVLTSGAPASLTWPGPEPAAGFEIAFETGAGVERHAEPGAWGLLRFLDGIRLRERDGGRRFLIDVRLSATRAYLELAFADPANPIAAYRSMRGLACPDAL